MTQPLICEGAGQVGADGRLSVDAEERGSTAAGTFGPALAGAHGAPISHCPNKAPFETSMIGRVTMDYAMEVCSMHYATLEVL